MNTNHTERGFVVGSCEEMSLELVLLHLKKIGGVLKE